MPISVKDFMTAFNAVQGGLGINHFMVTFAPPSTQPGSPGGSSLVSGSMQNLSVLCDSVPLPGLMIVTGDKSLPYGYGPNYKMPIGAVFTDLELRFIGDAQGFVHKIFTDWLNSVVTTNVQAMSDNSNAAYQPYLVSYLDDISTTITIDAFDPKGNKVITYKLFKAYPTYLGDIQGDWGAQDQIMKVPVKLSFVNWQVSYSSLTSASGTTTNAASIYNNLLSQGISYSTNQVNLPLTNVPIPASSQPPFQSSADLLTIAGLPTSDASFIS